MLVVFKISTSISSALVAVSCSIQAGLVLCNFFLCDFALMQLENLYRFSNVYDNFWLNVI